jgi:hypothetical protein
VKRCGLFFLLIACYGPLVAQVKAIQLEPEQRLEALPNFHYRVDPPSDPHEPLGSSVAFQKYSSGNIVARRILSDAARRAYLGYEMLLEPQGQAGTYLVSVRALDPQTAGLQSDGWTLQPPAIYPRPRIMREGEMISIDMGTDGASEGITDDVLIVPPQPRTQAQQLWETDYFRFMAYKSGVNGELRKRGLEPAEETQPGFGRPPPRSAPAIAGTPQPFSAADAELKIGEPRIGVNGGPEGTHDSLEAATGSLVWFHIPGRGRYILSLTPRPELGFTRAGEVRGGSLTVSVDGDTFSLESSLPIAPGGGPYFVYAAHDPEWQPTSVADRGRWLTGSVSPGELASLRREQVK